MEVVVLTDRRYVGTDLAQGPVDGYVENVILEDTLVCDALERHGLRVSRRAWCDPNVIWSDVTGAVFRTTWDYFDRWAEFSAWLEGTASKTSLLNAPSILRWNLDKHYLQDLEAEGIGVVPTAYLSQGSALSLAEVMAHRNWDDVVVKPAIAGGAYDTYRVTQTEDKPKSRPSLPCMKAASPFGVRFWPSKTCSSSPFCMMWWNQAKSL